MPAREILIIDDEEAVCWALERALKGMGHRVRAAATAEQGIALAARQPPDAIILDVRLPGMDGLAALPLLREKAPGAAVIVVTAFGDLPTAVQAVEGGAFDYLAKPFDLSAALDAVTRALSRLAPTPAAAEGPLPGPDDLIGVGPAMQQVFKRIALVAPHDSCVLITGESGTGKELVARAIHRYSPRRDRPFVPVHIAALNPNLVESELFGHVKGAFTGAGQSRTGLFALADGGTVFLDELAEVPLPVQVKLLRALEHNEITPVGAAQPQKLDIRILAATHQDLSRCVAEESFRHDLFFRLNVFEVRLPALRERPEDIPALAAHFLRRFRSPALPPETVRYLQSRPWPGNVRELRNALEHAAILARGEALLPSHFPEPRAEGRRPEEELPEAVRHWLAERIRAAGESAPEGLYDDLLAVVEKALLGDLMRRLKGNRWVAAQWLGLNRATVRKKLAAHGLADVDGEDGEE
jgi:two-component system nitrogen regulation response regulator GlnG